MSDTVCGNVAMWVRALTVCVALLVGSMGLGALDLESPGGDVRVRVLGGEIGEVWEVPGFEVWSGGVKRLGVELDWVVNDVQVFSGVVVKSWVETANRSGYRFDWGKSSTIRDDYNQLVLDLEQEVGGLMKLQLLVRVYDDGVAYRVVVPEQSGLGELRVGAESSRFVLEGNPRVWPLYRENYTTSHEGLYAPSNLDEVREGRLIDLPLLAEFAGGFSVAITEAALRGYPGLYLKAERRGSGVGLVGDLSPLPGGEGIKARGVGEFATPWRVLMMGSDPGRLIESDLVLSLNEPAVDPHPEWLEAGKATWYWWNGPYQEGVPFEVGLNWETMKYYIDFCAENGVKYHAIMSTPDEYPWYFQTQRGYGPGADSDVTRPREGFPMERVAAYAKERGVRLRLWTHWKPLSERLEEAFTQYERWGIAGLMVDFLDRDDQEMVEFAERVLESAMRHRLHIQFHGVWKPTGLRRTFPNLFNHEAVLNLEYLKWGKECDPEHNVTVPFTRMLAGPLDYHLGGFRSVSREEFEPRMMQPVVLGTRAHHLAMYVVYDNPMPMVADAPSAYVGQAGWDFVREVPTTWDETRVLEGRVGDYIVMARRKGEVWYVGAMTDWSPRRITVALDFLGEGFYVAERWADDSGAGDPNRLKVGEFPVERDGRLGMDLGAGGGQVVRLVR